MFSRDPEKELKRVYRELTRDFLLGIPEEMLKETAENEFFQVHRNDPDFTLIDRYKRILGVKTSETELDENDKFLLQLLSSVGPHYPVKREGGLEKASVHRHTVAYANKPRANGHVEPILPEYGVSCKRPTKSGHHRDPRSETATVSL